jgi:hypothetical protein
MDNKIMYKKILTSIAFIATIGLSQSVTVSTISTLAEYASSVHAADVDVNGVL